MEKPDAAAPIACTLNAAELRERRALARSRLAPHLLGSERTPSGVTFTFARTDALLSELEGFVELERQCCGFLSFTLTPEKDTLSLGIEGAPEAAATIEMFASALAEPEK